MLLVGSYWGYSIDLECQLQHCLAEHTQEATGCSAPAKTVDPPLVVICPEHISPMVLTPIWPLMPAQPLLLHQSLWPPEPEFVRQPVPPRAPPHLA
jgi:hypothetical protein